jgi:hypothetical protein
MRGRDEELVVRCLLKRKEDEASRLLGVLIRGSNRRDGRVREVVAIGFEVANECSLQAFGGAAGFVLNVFAAKEHAIAGTFDDGEMGENVYTLGGENKPVSSSAVIPLNCSNRHPDTSGETGRRLCTAARQVGPPQTSGIHTERWSVRWCEGDMVPARDRARARISKNKEAEYFRLFLPSKIPPKTGDFVGGFYRRGEAKVKTVIMRKKKRHSRKGCAAELPR